jgi:hypothetical protein
MNSALSNGEKTAVVAAEDLRDVERRVPPHPPGWIAELAEDPTQPDMSRTLMAKVFPCTGRRVSGKLGERSRHLHLKTRSYLPDIVQRRPRR